MAVLVSLQFLACVGLVAYVFIYNKRIKKEMTEKTARVKDAEAQIVHMEKMASLGTLAAGIAHEINNPLGFLISNLQNLKDYSLKLEQIVPAQAKENQYLVEDFKAMTQEALDGAVRIKKIVSDLRTFSRRSESQNIAVDVNRIVESVLAIVWNEIKYKVTLVKDYQAKTNILGDPTELSQVFLNIVINANQAMTDTDKGTISINTYEDGAKVYIKMADTGSGIPPEVLPKIFDPFFSTKAKGTGLGLSVTYNIVKHHGGDIKVESKVGAGTTFIVELPKPAEENNKNNKHN